MQVQQLECENQALHDHVKDVDQQYAALYHQLQDVHAKWCGSEMDKFRLQEEVTALKALQVRTCLLVSS